MMEEKVVVVTGSSSGIGRSTAIAFSRLGCKVVVHGTNKTNIEKVAQECLEVSPNNNRPLEIVCDLKSNANIETFMETVIARYNRLDVLVNNAGLFKAGHIDDVDAFEMYREMMQINLDQVVLMTILAVPHLKKTKGCIVNVSSNLHFKCMNGAFSYCTAKAGLTMLTKSLAVDLAPHVRVNSVSPGPIATSMSTRSGVSIEDYKAKVSSACLVERIGEPDEVARVIVFLASPDSSFINGSDYIVDGGSSIKPSGKIIGEE